MKTSRLASLILVVPALLSGPVHGEDAVGKLELTLPSFKPEVSSPPLVTGAQVTLSGLDDGPWLIQWWDTLEGKPVGASQATASRRSPQLEPPAFQADIAARLKKK